MERSSGILRLMILMRRMTEGMTVSGVKVQCSELELMIAMKGVGIG